METLTKTDFKELEENYGEMKFDEIQTLFKIIKRFNLELMETCDNGYKFNHVNAREITYELDVILNVINEKLEPLKNIEAEFITLRNNFRGI